MKSLAIMLPRRESAHEMDARRVEKFGGGGSRGVDLLKRLVAPRKFLSSCWSGRSVWLPRSAATPTRENKSGQLLRRATSWKARTEGRSIRCPLTLQGQREKSLVSSFCIGRAAFATISMHIRACCECRILSTRWHSPFNDGMRSFGLRFSCDTLLRMCDAVSL